MSRSPMLMIATQGQRLPQTDLLRLELPSRASYARPKGPPAMGGDAPCTIPARHPAPTRGRTAVSCAEAKIQNEFPDPNLKHPKIASTNGNKRPRSTKLVSRKEENQE